MIALTLVEFLKWAALLALAIAVAWLIFWLMARTGETFGPDDPF